MGPACAPQGSVPVFNRLYMTFPKVGQQSSCQKCRTMLERILLRQTHSGRMSPLLAEIVLLAVQSLGTSWQFMQLFHHGFIDAGFLKFGTPSVSIRETIGYKTIGSFQPWPVLYAYRWKTVPYYCRLPAVSVRRRITRQPGWDDHSLFFQFLIRHCLRLP